MCFQLYELYTQKPLHKCVAVSAHDTRPAAVCRSLCMEPEIWQELCCKHFQAPRNIPVSTCPWYQLYRYEAALGCAQQPLTFNSACTCPACTCPASIAPLMLLCTLQIQPRRVQDCSVREPELWPTNRERQGHASTGLATYGHRQ